MIKWLPAAGVLVASVLLLGCVGEEQVAVDCGSGESVSTGDFPNIILQSGDVAADLSSLPTSATVLDDVGDQYFKDTVEPSRYVGGLTAMFVSGDVLQGGRGRLVSSIVMAFTDVDAATVLADHPSVGEASVDRPVETPRFGDASDSRYIEVSDGDKLVGHIIQFRVGRVVVYITNLAFGENPAISETERLALLVCDRIRQQ